MAMHADPQDNVVHLVVEVVDVDPFDALPLVFVLLLLQDELDEQLLELLVAVVDAELLKGVVFEHLRNNNNNKIMSGPQSI